MAAKPICLVCQKEMEPGFLIDMGHNAKILIPRWCPGTPKPSFWSGEAKLSQYNEGLLVTAYRCPECEALRLYAPSTPR